MKYYVKYGIIISDESFLLRFIYRKQTTTKNALLRKEEKNMAKIVRYNGETMSYYGCSEPTELVVGKEYEVISANDRGWQTDYTLKGVKGHFNSVWFDDVNSKNTAKTFMALAHTVPVVGERCKCSKLKFVNGQPKLIGWNTSTVNEVSDMGNNIYRVITHNSTYIVQVG